MPASYQRLYINIDHVATVRQARGGVEPDPIAAAVLSEASGADGTTAHLREDRRHIGDADVDRLATTAKYFNFECACTDEMIALALRVRPQQITLVPERREERTTEGGLAVAPNAERIEAALVRLKDAGIRTALFIAPNKDSVSWSHQLGADAIELHTGQYADHPNDASTITAMRNSAHHAASLGLAVHAGHGLTIGNVTPVAEIPEIEELNIGHSIVGRAIFIGLAAAVREMRDAMTAARAK